MTRTRAIGAFTALPTDDPDCLVEVEIDVPDPTGHDLLVEVRAVSVNPVDTKVRRGLDQQTDPRVLGFDASGVVVAVGPEVTAYAPGDEVYYAGRIDRPGSNAERQLVDERVVGRKPRTLDWAEAAALPLTTITAWETLFDRFRVDAESTQRLLVVSAAGGVGSMVLQLARARTSLELVATASRPESREWATAMGAHHLADHHDLVDSVRAVVPSVDLVFSPVSEGNVASYVELLTPGGAVVAIDEPEGLELLPLKDKSLAWHWELMFTTPLFLPESTAQRELLDATAALVDAGSVRTTLSTRLDGLTADNLRRAHALLESGSTVGKVAITV